jgi:hypothetical protein
LDFLAWHPCSLRRNFITNWVKQAVAGQVLKATPAEKVEWIEADELWT